MNRCESDMSAVDNVPVTNARGAAVVLGAGPGLGLAIARRFGQAGHPVALVSRSADRHQSYLDTLAADGSTAIAEVADVLDTEQTATLFERITERLGPIEMLYFGPASMSADNIPVPMDQLTGSNVRSTYRLVESLVDTVASVLPGMVSRGRGSILLPTGVGAIRAMPELGQLALAAAAIRTYATALNTAVAERGVFVAPLIIGGGIRGGDIYQAMAERNLDELADAGLDPEQLAKLALDPEHVADEAYAMTVSRDRAELVFSVLD